MYRLVHIGAVLFASAFATATPLMAQDTPFPAMIDEIYSGSLTVEVFPADGGRRLHRDTGTAEVRFSQHGDGQIAFSTTGMIEDSGGFELGAQLQSGPDGAWREFSDAGTGINAAGRFLSISVADGFEMILTGQISPREGRFTLRRLPTEAATAADGAFTVVFSLDVEIPEPETEVAPAAEAGSAEAATEQDGGCERVEWRLVNRWNPFGGSMRLDREPYCAQY
ncbi:hypothetical protein [Devosia sp. A369]